MKKKVTSVFASCVAASLIVAAFGGMAFADEVTEEPTYEEPVYEEPVYEEPVYEEPSSTESSSGSRTLVSVNTYYDCDGSGNGYYEYVYSDGSVEYEDFYASSGSSSDSSSSSESSYDSSYDSSSDSSSESASEEAVVEETVEEEIVEEETVEEEEEESDRIEWTMDEIASIPDVVSGVEDKEYAANSARKYNVHMGVNFDKDIVDGVLFNTSGIDFSTAGEYDMTYFVYFNREALVNYIGANNLSEEDFPGLADATEDRFEIVVNGKVTIN